MGKIAEENNTEIRRRIVTSLYVLNKRKNKNSLIIPENQIPVREL